MHEEIYSELRLYPNLELIIKDANNDSELQKQQIQELIASGVDLLIVSPNEAEPLTPLVEEAYYKNLAVIILDRKTKSELYTAYIGADNFEIGKAAGQYIANQALGKETKIIEIFGLRGSSPAMNRNLGFEHIIQQYPNLDLVATINGNWEKEDVLTNLPDVLKQHQDTKVIYAHNDRMALGAYQVCEQLGLKDSISIIGIDGLAGPNGGIAYVADGLLNATFLYPTGGEAAVRLAAKILNNEPFEKENILPTTLINANNVHVLRAQTDRILNQQQHLEQQSRTLANYRFQRNVLLGVSVLLSLLLFWSVFNRRSQKQRLDPKIETSTPPRVSSNTKQAIQPAEQSFIEQFKQSIKDNLSNPEFGVKDLCRELGLSRAQIYRKVKSELGYSVGDYLQKARLETAVKLLKTTDLSISDIAYQVGYNSPSYFSTAFKTKYDCSPSDYRKKL